MRIEVILYGPGPRRVVLQAATQLTDGPMGVSETKLIEYAAAAGTPQLEEDTGMTGARPAMREGGPNAPVLPEPSQREGQLIWLEIGFALRHGGANGLSDGLPSKARNQAVGSAPGKNAKSAPKCGRPCLALSLILPRAGKSGCYGFPSRAITPEEPAIATPMESNYNRMVTSVLVGWLNVRGHPTLLR